MTRQRRYLSYLLRLWQESGGSSVSLGEAPLWRASLESPQSDKRQGFASLNELVAFLQEQTRGTLPGDVLEKDEGKPKGSAESEEDQNEDE